MVSFFNKSNNRQRPGANNPNPYMYVIVCPTWRQAERPQQNSTIPSLDPYVAYRRKLIAVRTQGSMAGVKKKN